MKPRKKRNLQHKTTLTKIIMKNKKSLFTFLVCIPLLGGLLACKSEPQKVENEPEIFLVQGITIHFLLPGKETHILDPRATQDNPEWAIDQLWLYEFDKDGERVVAEPKNIRTSPYFKYLGSDATYTYKENWHRDEVRQFYFVANMKLEGIAKGTAMSQFKAKLHEKQMNNSSKDILYAKDETLYTNGPLIPIAEDNNFRIPMVGQAMQGAGYTISTHSNASISVKLKRTLARIDIVNCIPGFEITKLELFNAFKQSKVFEDGKVALPDNRVSTAVASFADLNETNKVGKREGALIKKAFYLYEGNNTDGSVKDNEITYIKITANYGKGLEGKEREFIVPFKTKDTSGKFNQAKDIKRNHLYKIILGNIQKEKQDLGISFKIKEEEWNTHTLESVMQAIYFKGVTLTEETYNTGTLEVNRASNKLKIELYSDFVNNNNDLYDTPEVIEGKEWITEAKIEKGTEVSSPYTLSLTIMENDKSEVRRGKLKIMCKPIGKEYILTIKQVAK